MHQIFQVLTDHLMSKERGEDLKRLTDIEKELEQISLLENKMADAVKDHDWRSKDIPSQENHYDFSSYSAYLLHVESVLNAIRKAVESMDDTCDNSFNKLIACVSEMKILDWDAVQSIPSEDDTGCLESLIDSIEISLENICHLLYELSQIGFKTEVSIDKQLKDTINPQDLLKHECPTPLFKTIQPACGSSKHNFEGRVTNLMLQNRKFLDDRRNNALKSLRKIRALSQRNEDSLLGLRH